MDEPPGLDTRYLGLANREDTDDLRRESAQPTSLSQRPLVLAQLFNAFNARSDRVSAFHHLFTNRLLWGAIGLSLVLQVAVVQLTFLNSAFDTTPLAPGDWLIGVALASIVLFAVEAKKLLRHGLQRSRNRPELTAS